MGKESKIEWTQDTHNFWYGCTKISPGCDHCYAAEWAKRYGKNFDAITKTKMFNAPLIWREPRIIFIESLGDFFHPGADHIRPEAWDIMREANWHTYLPLTKRPENITDRLPADWDDGWDNVWGGATAENQEMADKRVPLLPELPFKHRFVSVEPMLSGIDLSKWLKYFRRCDKCKDTGWITGIEKPCSYCNPYGEFRSSVDPAIYFKTKIEFVICGAESGPNRRETKIQWVRDLKDQCVAAGVRFMYKQGPDDTGKWCKMPVLDGRVWDQMPEVLHND